MRTVERNNVKLTLLFAVMMLPISSFAAHEHHMVPDAPIGIMGYHLHPEGEWMMSYSYMKMQMEGNLEGSQSVDTPLPNYMVSPLNMDMNMHMLGAMYGYSDNIAFMAMLPVINYSMNLQVKTGKLFTTESAGIGDLKLSALIKTGTHWISSAGLNLPTGSIENKDVNPMSNGQAVPLPYPMQSGSGSYELTLGTAYIKKMGASSWGNKADFIFRLNDNDRDYKLGNSVELNSWYSLRVSDKSTVSLRLKFLDWGNISGADTDLNPMLVPTADANLRAGRRADILLGFNFQLTKAMLLGVETGVPVYQNLDGPQLETDLTLQAGVQYSF